MRTNTACLSVLVVCIVVTAAARAETVYFKVAEFSPLKPHHDSYVLPLSDPADIAAARNLIAQGPLNVSARLVVARIAPGADGINRNLDAPFQTWNWHVTEFLEFAELTAEIYDGWPTYVESDVPGWMNNTGGTVGFWSYSVVAELHDIPEPAGVSLMVIGAAGLAIVVWRQRGRR